MKTILWRSCAVVFALMTISCAYKPSPLPATYKPVFTGEITRITKPIKISYKPANGTAKLKHFSAIEGELEKEVECKYLYNIEQQDNMLAVTYEPISAVINGKVKERDFLKRYTISDIFSNKGVLMSLETVSSNPKYSDVDIENAMNFPIIPITKTRIKTNDIITNSDFIYSACEELFEMLELKVDKSVLNSMLPRVRGLCQYKGKTAILLSTDATRMFTNKLRDLNGKRMSVRVSLSEITILDRDTLDILKSEQVVKIKSWASIISWESFHYWSYEKE